MPTATPQIIIPESSPVQPQEFELFSMAAERGSKTISTYAALANCDRGRMKAVEMDFPNATGLRLLTFILASGDRRYWSWAAKKRRTHGKVRTSLMWELNVDRGNLSRALAPLLEDGTLVITENDSGIEVITIAAMGKMTFAELRWRWFLRDSAPELLVPIADLIGWYKVSRQVDYHISVEMLDPTRRADVVAAAQAEFKLVAVPG